MDASPTERFSWKTAFTKLGHSLTIGIAVILAVVALLAGLSTGLTSVSMMEAEYRRLDEMIYTASGVVTPKNPVVCFQFPHPGATNPESSRVGVLLPSGERARVLINHGKGALDCPATHFALQVEHMTPK